MTQFWIGEKRPVKAGTRRRPGRAIVSTRFPSHDWSQKYAPHGGHISGRRGNAWKPDWTMSGAVQSRWPRGLKSYKAGARAVHCRQPAPTPGEFPISTTAKGYARWLW